MKKFQPIPKRFMVWDTKEGKFLGCQDWAILPTLSSCSATIPYDYPGRKITDLQCVDWEDTDMLEDRYLICQSTNLFDKDGKEIFEGSIIETSRGRKFLVEFSERHGLFGVHVPELDNTCKAYESLWTVIRNEKVRLIGHILSNPELLEEV